MKEHPILLNGDMVRAVQDGRKTMTRRVIKPQHKGGVITGPAAESGYAIEAWGGGKRHIASKINCLSCPYGIPGDRLWVRETWATERQFDHLSPSNIPASAHKTERIMYEHFTHGWDKARPSIHMPRWASRITLEVVSVRVERVQEITEDDAKAEGIASTVILESDGKDYTGQYARDGFACLWDSIYAKRGYGWDVNPLVWVIEFKQLTAAGRERKEGE